MKTSDCIKTFFLVAIVLFFTLQRDYGFLLSYLWFFFLVALLYNFVQMARKRDERKKRGIKIAIWFVTLALPSAVQSYWAKGSRNEGDVVAKAVLEYKTRTGVYPASLKEVGLDEQGLKNKWQLRYVVREGKPVLVYPAALMPLTTYEYDFDKRRWRGNAY